MNALERLVARQACEDLVLRLHLYVDTFQHDLILPMFMPDAVVDNVLVGRLSGIDELRAYYDSKNTAVLGQHITTNFVIDFHDDDHASAVTYYTYYFAGEGYSIPAPLAGPIVVGLYRDEFVRSGGEWKFQSRHMTNQFQVGPMDQFPLVNR